MWKLMTDNAILSNERRELSEFILNSDKLTQGPWVKEFERVWSEWQGCDYSVFVNSGSSANLLLVRALAEKGQTWVCQASTWVTNVSPVIQNNLDLLLCDISLDNFGPRLDLIELMFKEHKNCVLFLTHFIGFPAISETLLGLCEKYNVVLVEDCCESPGATFGGNKIGNFGAASTFSFYYGHHMTTLEGGMICTNDEDLYHQFLLLRSHGMLRELPLDKQNDYIVEGVDPKFTFLRDGYNVRSCEINAKLGIMQVERLNQNIDNRNNNYREFVFGLDASKYYCNFLDDGISSFCLPIISKQGNIDAVKILLESEGIEYRPFIGGNLFKHPIFSDMDCIYNPMNSEFISGNCVYVGNHQDVTVDMVSDLVFKLNKI